MCGSTFSTLNQVNSENTSRMADKTLDHDYISMVDDL